MPDILHDDDYTELELAEEIQHIERVLTVEDIFHAAFNIGHASRTDRYEVPFRRWLAAHRADRGL